MRLPIKSKQNKTVTWKKKTLMWSAVILLGLINAAIKESQPRNDEES